MLRIGVKTSMWNPWHGCHKFSTGCQHCYVYRTDGKYGKDSSVVTKTEKFNLPIQQKKNKTYKIPSGNLVYTCFTSEFLVEDADVWRIDYRLPIYKAAPIKHKIIICEPLLSRIDFRGELGEWVEQVVAGGESGRDARICDYDWVLEIRRQCIDANVGFWFKQTGSFLLKEGKEFKVARQFQHSQARKAEINYEPDRPSLIEENTGNVIL